MGNDEYKINGRYKLQNFDDLSQTPIYNSNDSSHPGMKIFYNQMSRTWKIAENLHDYRGFYIEWKNTENVSHPGQLNTEAVMHVANKNETPIPQLKITS